MKEPDLEKYAGEVNAMQDLPSASVELSPLAALAIISHIQLAIRHPEIANSEFAKIAIDVAKQLQNLFNKDSETYKVLELGWNPKADFLTPSGELDDKFCKEPSDKRISLETLAAGAAMMQQRQRNFKSENFEFLDM
jgi:hypothetical protein